MAKKRILFVSEFSALATGFATYMHNLIPRLYATGKYEIAELAVYCQPNDPRIHSVPWKVYPNEPHPQDHETRQLFDADQTNQFGKFHFENVCLDFRPDIVVSICDPWMCHFVEYSPYRKYFKWVYMPTVDGEPQKEEWLKQYESADNLLTYSVWGKNLIERQSPKIHVDAVASPGAQLDLFRPREKSEVRAKYGLSNDINIIQTVMRNQPRKLFPELFKAFRLFLDRCEAENNLELASKTFLHIHTGNPDVGWDLPSEIRRNNIAHKVLFTYMNERNGSIFIDFFNGNERQDFRFPGTKAKLPNTVVGASREQLGEIMSCADLYVQYAVAEGFGLPLVDSKSCGVPSMAINYSAMSEQVNIDGCIPLTPKKFVQEPQNQTGQLRAQPDNEDTADKFYNFFTQTQETRDEMGRKCRENVEKFYNWDRVASIWETVFDSVIADNHQNTWLKPLQLIKPNLQVPPNLNNKQFVEWCYGNIVQDTELLNHSIALKTIQALNDGYEMMSDQHGRPIRKEIDRNKVAQSLLGRVDHQNHLEQIRYNRCVLPPQEKKEFQIQEV